jgi:hypothetical protein
MFVSVLKSIRSNKQVVNIFMDIDKTAFSFVELKNILRPSDINITQKFNMCAIPPGQFLFVFSVERKIYPGK